MNATLAWATIFTFVLERTLSHLYRKVLFHYTEIEIKKVEKSIMYDSLNSAGFEKIAIFMKLKLVGNFSINSDLANNYQRIFLEHT